MTVRSVPGESRDARHGSFRPHRPQCRFRAGQSRPSASWDRTLTYAELAERIAQTARALKSQLGIGRGDRVAILAANHPDYLVLLYACARLGAMLVPLNWRLAVPSRSTSSPTLR